MRIFHLLLLPVWIAASYWTVRTLDSDRHLSRAKEFIDTPATHVAELEQSLRLNPWNGFALAAMGRVMTAREDWPRVIEYSNKALTSVFYFELLSQRANALFQLGETRSDYRLNAYEEYRRILLFLPNDRDAMYRLAHLCFRMGKFAEAEGLLRQMLAIHTPASDVLYELNLVQAKQHRYREAMHSVQRFLLLGPSPNMGPEVFKSRDWSKHLLQWNKYLPTVEAGKMKPAEGGTVTTDRGRAPRAR